MLGATTRRVALPRLRRGARTLRARQGSMRARAPPELAVTAPEQPGLRTAAQAPRVCSPGALFLRHPPAGAAADAMPAAAMALPDSCAPVQYALVPGRGIRAHGERRAHPPRRGGQSAPPGGQPLLDCQAPARSVRLSQHLALPEPAGTAARGPPAQTP